MYIKGACKDGAAPFPQLRRCRHVATDLDDPEHGAGVRVNRFLKNVNWLAIPGYKLFYTGGLEQGERLTQAQRDATVREAMLDEIIAFLNDKNREYATGEADYNWSGVYDNCVHTAR